MQKDRNLTIVIVISAPYFAFAMEQKPFFSRLKWEILTIVVCVAGFIGIFIAVKYIIEAMRK